MLNLLKRKLMVIIYQKYLAKEKRAVSVLGKGEAFRKVGSGSSVRLENKVGKFVPWGGEVQVLKNKRPGDLSRGIVNWVKEFEFYPETNGML